MNVTCTTCGVTSRKSLLRVYQEGQYDPAVYWRLAVGFQMAAQSLYALARRARRKARARADRFWTRGRSRDFDRYAERAREAAKRARASTFRYRWELSRCPTCRRPRRIRVGVDGTGGFR